MIALKTAVAARTGASVKSSKRSDSCSMLQDFEKQQRD
jgi:hypothetical protein